MRQHIRILRRTVRRTMDRRALGARLGIVSVLSLVLVTAGAGAKDEDPEFERQLRSLPIIVRYEYVDRQDREEFKARIRRAASSALDRALASGDDLWVFLIDPDTPYFERMAAALRGGQVIALDQLPYVEEVFEQLSRASRDTGSWGVGPPPGDARFYPNAWKGGGPFRGTPTDVLGHLWVPQHERILPWPRTTDELVASPWPWQIFQAIIALSRGMSARMHSSHEDWLRVIAGMPCTTNAEKSRFLRVTAPLHLFKPDEDEWLYLREILSTWRAIALSSASRSFPSVPRHLASLQRLWFDTPYRFVPQALLRELLLEGPVRGVRGAVVSEMNGLRNGWAGRRVELPIPAMLVLDAEAWIFSLDDDTLHSRLYWVNDLLKSLGAQTIPLDYRIDSPPETLPRLATFRDWFDLQRSSLQILAEQERPKLEKALALVPYTGRCGAQ